MRDTNRIDSAWLAPPDTEAQTVEGQSPTARRLMRLWQVAIIALVGVNLVLALWHAVTTGDPRRLLSHQLLTPFLALGYLLLGTTVIRHRPHNVIGWLLLVTGSCYAFSGVAAGLHVYGSALPVAISPALMDLADWLNIWVWLPAQLLPLTFVLLLFPDGHLPSPAWRWVGWAAGLGIGLTALGLALHPQAPEMWATGPNPYGLSGPVALLDGLMVVGTALLALGGIGSLVAIGVRYRGSSGLERQQMKWLVLAAVLIAAVALLLLPVWLAGDVGETIALELSILLTSLMTLGIAAAISIAIVGYGLYGIDVLINRALVYTILTAIILLVYGVVVGGVNAFAQSQSNWAVAVVVTVAVVILFQPLRDRLQRGMNRLLYGQRDEPFEVLAQLGQQLEQTITPEAVYPTIVETVATALRLPYVGLQEQTAGGLTTVSARGRLVGEPLLLPLTYQGEVVGRLVVGPRSAGEALSETDERLLRNIARQAGVAVYNTRLTAELQRSRQQLVTGREEERRRLRRDLHDGLGPSLASLLLEARVLRRLIADDPAAAEALAADMQTDIRTTIDDIRRVVHELRPPALDDLGLVAALNLMATRIGHIDNGGASELHVTVDAPTDLPVLPAAVEVAAYRIAQEALTNVVYHARARRATVRLGIDGGLHIEVSDDGVGFSGGREGGIGLQSMRERAAELGGTWSIACQPGGGTIVRATLPLEGI